MEHFTAFWETSLAICPILGLALVVEMRHIRWSKLSPLARYLLSFLIGLALMALGIALLTSLGVLMRWGTGRPIPPWDPWLVYWAIYFGVAAVILVPVSQLWLVTFTDFSPRVLILLFQVRRLARQHAALLKVGEGQIRVLDDLRREALIVTSERIFANPSGVFASSSKGTSVEVTDPFVIQGRQYVSDVSTAVRKWEKRLKRRRKDYRRQQKDFIRRTGIHTEQAARRMRRYQKGTL